MSFFTNIVGAALGGPLGAWAVDTFGNQTSQGSGPVPLAATGSVSEGGQDAMDNMPIDQGTDGADTLHISNALIPDTLAGNTFAGSFYDVELNGRHKIMSRAELEATTFDLRGGDDTVIVDANVVANITARGGSGDDKMMGGAGNDHFDGGSGDDRLFGGTGNDRLTGGSGDDYLDGGAGKDIMSGGSGDNTVVPDLADFVSLLATMQPASSMAAVHPASSMATVHSAFRSVIGSAP
jgi:Ca2+-binding RTX toxin-like protein